MRDGLFVATRDYKYIFNVYEFSELFLGRESVKFYDFDNMIINPLPKIPKEKKSRFINSNAIDKMILKEVFGKL